jgi:ABC-type multidrug transport system ATPase subunit
LLKLLAGLTLPTRGTVNFDDAAKAPNDQRRRQQIGLLTPADHLYDNLTVKENLNFFCQLYGKRDATKGIENALADVSLLKRADEYVANLSSGMRCRLSIAKWQLLEPGLLLLDEPYGVLDGSGINLLETFLTKRCTQGKIVILASHHVSRVLKLCSRAVILHQGRLTFDEPRKHPWPNFDAAFGEFLPHGETWSS